MNCLKHVVRLPLKKRRGTLKFNLKHIHKCKTKSTKTKKIVNKQPCVIFVFKSFGKLHFKINRENWAKTTLFHDKQP